jgi:hypothetical protein
MDLDSLLKYSQIVETLGAVPFVRDNSLFQTELAGVKSGIDLRIRLNKRIPKENLLDFTRYLLANHGQYTAPQLKLTLRIFFANYTSRCYALTNPEIQEITKNLSKIDPTKEFYKLWLGIMNQYVFSDMSKLVQKEYEFIHNKQDYSQRLKKLKEINDSISVFLKTQKDTLAKNPNFLSNLQTDSQNRLNSYRSLLNIHGKLKTVYKWSENYDDYFYYKLQTIAINNFYTVILMLDSHFMTVLENEPMTSREKSVFVRKNLDEVFNSLMLIGFKMILKNY